MVQRTVIIEDTLDDRVKSAIAELREVIQKYLDENPDINETPCDSLFCDEISEIADNNTPIYTREIEDLWYLYAPELEEAYENAGIGENPRATNGALAIYCYIEETLLDQCQSIIDELYEEFVERQEDEDL